MRYELLIEIIKRRKPAVIVEVGSSNRGISSYIDVESFGLDLSFDPEVNPGLQRRICASGTGLPFKDGSADVVLSVDMLEHVPAEIRPLVLKEMFRVVRTEGVVYVALPVGENSEAADIRVQERFIKSTGKPHPMLVDHVENGLPTRDEIVFIVDEIASSKGWSVSFVENMPIRLWEWNLTWFGAEPWLPGLRHLQRVIAQPLYPILSRLKSEDNYRLILIARKGER